MRMPRVAAPHGSRRQQREGALMKTKAVKRHPAKLWQLRLYVMDSTPKIRDGVCEPEDIFAKPT